MVTAQHSTGIARQAMSTSAERAFSRVYAKKLWGDDAGRGAGPGSTPEATQALSALLAHLVITLNITSMLDVPCGAMAWQPGVLDVLERLRAIDGLDGRPASRAHFRYTGVDIVPSVIQEDARRFPDLRFVHADVANAESFVTKVSPLGPFDLVLSRAVFYHLSNHRILSALRNIKRTGSKWLLASTHAVRTNVPNATWLAGRRHGLDEGGFRPVNLQLPPFSLPPPRWTFVDSGGENTAELGPSQGKQQLLALWRLDDINV